MIAGLAEHKKAGKQNIDARFKSWRTPRISVSMTHQRTVNNYSKTAKSETILKLKKARRTQRQFNLTGIYL
jgi:hypothetical protein